MLQKEAVAQEMMNIIKELQKNSLFKDYVLVGGTALALQLGHRTSTDIDLFTQKKQNTIGLIDFFKKYYNDIEIEVAQEDFIRLYPKGIKVEMVWYEEEIINKAKIKENIRLLGINEIASMKLKAITTRTEPRDFIDIAYLLKEMSLKKMFDLYRENFGSISPLYIKRTLLTKSKSIKENEWLVNGIKMLRDDIKPKDVPIYIEKAIEEYNKNINVGKTNDPAPTLNISQNKSFNHVEERKINIQINTNLDNFINSSDHKNMKPKEITESLFTNIKNDIILFNKVIAENYPNEQIEYAKGYSKIVSKAHEKIYAFFTNGDQEKKYKDMLKSLYKEYENMEIKHRNLPPGDYNDGMYKAVFNLKNSINKAIQIINNYDDSPPPPPFLIHGNGNNKKKPVKRKKYN